jgi:hypothetical protein
LARLTLFLWLIIHWAPGAAAVPASTITATVSTRRAVTFRAVGTWAALTAGTTLTLRARFATRAALTFGTRFTTGSVAAAFFTGATGSAFAAWAVVASCGSCCVWRFSGLGLGSAAAYEALDTGLYFAEKGWLLRLLLIRLAALVLILGHVWKVTHAAG